MGYYLEQDEQLPQQLWQEGWLEEKLLINFSLLVLWQLGQTTLVFASLTIFSN